MLTWLLQAMVGLLPVLVFLAALMAIDSYRLVDLKTVLATVVAGAAAAVVAYWANGAVMEWTGLDMRPYSRWVAPLLEEAVKAAMVVVLIRLGRIGFLVDAAIYGFASGAGFSVLENAFYLTSTAAGSAGLGVWIVRGFGTAIMHGGATAILAVTTLSMLDQASSAKRARVLAIVPGFVLAAAVHSAYNHTLLQPVVQMLIVLVAVPALLLTVFHRSEKALAKWLGTGFDADADLLELLNSGQLTLSPLGKYLTTLKQRFHGPMVADILCYVRLHTELALRAKGILMMRANGFEAPLDQPTRDKFTELRFLERSIGRAGQMAIRPMLHMSRKDLRQLYLID